MENKVLFSNLPSPITIDILSRLPTNTIVRCRCVCKTWFKLISDPEFVDLHLSRSPTHLIINNLSASTPESSCFNVVEIEDEPDYHVLDYVAGLKMELPKSHSGVTMVGSINGLVCLNEFGYQYDAVHIWNPTTREFITVPTPEGIKAYPSVTVYGFGLSSVTGRYKVARIFQEFEIVDSETRSRGPITSVCHVYTLGSGSWRSIGRAPFLYNCRERGVFLNGNLHWLIDDPDGSEFISCLDVEKEAFQPFPSPLELSKQNIATLNLYEGCLSVCDNTSDFDIVIWVMKEYGIEKSWTKEAVISKYPIDLVGNYYEVVHVIKVLRHGEILLLWRDDWLFSYHPVRKTVANVDTLELIEASKKRTCRDVLYHCIEAMDHVSSFLSLKNFGTDTVNKI